MRDHGRSVHREKKGIEIGCVLDGRGLQQMMAATAIPHPVVVTMTRPGPQQYCTTTRSQQSSAVANTVNARE